MALDKNTLQSSIEEMLNNNESSVKDCAKNLADIIDKYVKTAEVQVIVPTGGIQVQGSPSAQANVAPLTFNGTLK